MFLFLSSPHLLEIQLDTECHMLIVILVNVNFLLMVLFNKEPIVILLPKSLLVYFCTDNHLARLLHDRENINPYFSKTELKKSDQLSKVW